MWRDYYTARELDNYTKPWETNMNDTEYKDTFNCLEFIPNRVKSWTEGLCWTDDMGCPCQYKQPPIVRLRGFCPRTDMDTIYIPNQLPGHPGITYVGVDTSQIQYDDTKGQWVLTDAWYNVTATSEATLESYLLGKHNWTVTGDDKRCFKDQTYTRQMRLTGCDQNGEFTCDDGQCVRMEQRCDQVAQCTPQQFVH